FQVTSARAGQSVSVTARRIGFTARTVSVTLSGATVTQDFSLVPTATQLTGIVVTALGQEKEKSQLGTAQQQLSSQELNTTFAPNIENQLEGKVSGLNIVGNGTEGGSTNITIRGFTSISGTNQPLFVVDGIPISNNDRGSQQQGGGITGSKDFGSVIQDINPDDIASVSVLKGPNAAALYGSRAANGAIIITTKRGSARNTTFDFNSSLTLDTPGRIPDFQNSYGQGSAGQFSWINGSGPLDGNDQSYGPRLSGQLINQFTGPNMPWVAHPNNVASFFNTGQTRDATLSVSGGSDRSNARLSLNGENVEGIIPNEFLRRLGGMVTGELQASDKLTFNGSLDYTRNDATNRPGQGYVGSVVEGLYVWFGRQVDMTALKDNWMNSATANGGPANREFNWNYSYHNNPYFMQYADQEADTRDRVIANGSATYKFANWLTATLRSGTDTYRYNIGSNFAEGDIELDNGSTTVNPAYNGAFSTVGETYTENNTDILVTANHELTSHFNLTGTVGGNRRYSSDNTNQVTVNGITVAGIYNVANAGLPPVNTQAVLNQAVNSTYGSGAFTYNGWWTVEATARNDWSSTLPRANNSYFYPSVNTSLVLSDAIPALRNNSVISYLKLRAGSAKVGNDAPPYSLATTYAGNSSKFDGQPLFSLGNTLLNPDLLPENTVSNEGGVELGLWNNRVSLDASLYDKYTTNEITSVTLPPSSGYASKLVNAGKIDNRGYEALLTIEPFKNARWDWSSTFNFSHNVGKVVSLLAPITFGAFQGSVLTEARAGEPFGTFRGFDILRDAKTGLPLLDDAGQYQKTDTMVVLGSIQPQWTGGWFNTVRFNRFTLSATIDVRHGGKIFSGTNFYGQATGTLASTMYGREVDWDNPGIVIHGIIQSTGQMNTTKITSEQYFQSLAYNDIAAPYVYNDSYLKLRDVRVGYDLPNRLANRLNASAVNIAFIGRNLFTSTNVPNIDPEVSYNTGSNQGIEYAALPAPRSLGFAVRITP
ncbi:MAG TPA: SusC/RagA family TonB-linked outer membrane protein, partial [Gemmatimonadaceae bacterium]|nr:SusC/RagA family TonB-linked outer membrane protein [Gemmatimonadaceae bacterium]